jgi:hypothetical protein
MNMEPMLTAQLQAETERLARSWMRHDQAMLADYLVADVEDPRINVQSILTRHFLIEQRFGSRFRSLRVEELRFAVVMNRLLAFHKNQGADAETRRAVLHALRARADNAEGVEVPGFLVDAFSALPRRAGGARVPNYLRRWLEAGASPPPAEGWDRGWLETFQRLWPRRLEGASGRRLSVLEPACGSANDYRFVEAFGLAAGLDYTGFDLCEKNILNASSRHPGARFRLGNVFDIETDRPFDVAYVHDLFEHLSPAGLERAIAELCRVTRSAICAHFFNMDEIDDHVVRPVDDYHWNTLSMARVVAAFEAQRATVQVIHIASFLRWLLGCGETHNQGAYTLIVTLLGANRGATAAAARQS